MTSQASELLLPELIRSVIALSTTQADGLRSISDLQSSVAVALDKLNLLEAFAIQMEERTKTLDSTHFTDIKETSKRTQSLVADIEAVKTTLQGVKDAIVQMGSLPDASELQTSIITELESALASVIDSKIEAYELKMTEVLKERIPAGLALLMNKYFLLGVAALFALLILAVVFLSGKVQTVELSTSGVKIDAVDDKTETPKIK